MNSYLDKQEKWLKDLVPHPLCFECGESFETFNHLMLECRANANLREALGIEGWNSILRCEIQLKFLVATILSSWTEAKGDYLKNMYDKYRQ